MENQKSVPQTRLAAKWVSLIIADLPQCKPAISVGKYSFLINTK